MLRPSCMQVPATLAFQRGSWAIKYSCVTVCNSAVGKPSYVSNQFEAYSALV